MLTFICWVGSAAQSGPSVGWLVLHGEGWLCILWFRTVQVMAAWDGVAASAYGSQGGRRIYCIRLCMYKLYPSTRFQAPSRY